MRRVIKIYCCFRKQHHLFHLGDIAPAGGVAGTAELSVALPQSRLGKVQASLTLLSLLHRFVFDAVLEDACLCYGRTVLLLYVSSISSLTLFGVMSMTFPGRPLSLHISNSSERAIHFHDDEITISAPVSFTILERLATALGSKE